MAWKVDLMERNCRYRPFSRALIAFVYRHAIAYDGWERLSEC